jgi:hypothetical protein
MFDTENKTLRCTLMHLMSWSVTLYLFGKVPVIDLLHKVKISYLSLKCVDCFNAWIPLSLFKMTYSRPAGRGMLHLLSC